MNLLSRYFTAGAVVLATNVFGQITWQSTGGPNGVAGGQVTSIAIQHWTSNVYAGTFGGGVLRSTDHGLSWTPVNTGLSDNQIHAVWCNWQDWSLRPMFAGTYNAGAYRSDDSGRTWIHISTGLNSNDVRCFTFDAGRGGVYYAGTYLGVCKSTDNGDHWTPVGGTALTEPVNALLITDSGAVLAGNGDGVWRSPDYGATWTKVSSFGTTYVQSLVRGNTGTVFAGIQNGGGVYRSTNNGWNWTAVNTGLKNLEVESLYWDDTTHAIVAGTRGSGGGGVFRSTDNGATWQSTAVTNAEVYAVAIGASGWLYAGLDGGVSVSSDNGATWAGASSPNTDVIALAATGSGSVWASASGAGVFHAAFRGDAWTKETVAADTTIFTLAVHPSGDVFAGSDGQGVLRSTDAGSDWKVNGIIGYSTYAVLCTPSGALYAGTYYGGVFRCPSVGGTWSASLTAGATSSSFTALCCDSSGNIYAGNDKGGLYVTTNDGTSWTAATSGLSGAIKSLTAGKSGTVLAATSVGVYRTVNAGASWTRVNNSGVFSAVAFAQGGLALAGWTGGIVTSTDDGVTWSAANTGLASLSIHSLAIDGDGYAYAGCAAGGVYRTAASTVGKPGTPVLLTAVPGNDSVTLTWQSNTSSNIDHCDVYVDTASAPTAKYAATTTADTSIALAGLNNGIQFYLRIKAVDAGGVESDFSNELSATPAQSIGGEYHADPLTAVLLHGDNSRATDASGHGNNGTLHNIKFVQGRFGAAMEFNGSNASITIPNAPSLNPTKAFTAEAWFQWEGSGDQEQFIFCKRGATDATLQYALSKSPANTLRAYLRTTGAPIVIDGATPLAAGAWTHVAMTYDGSKLLVYVNGREDGHGSATGAVAAGTSPLAIGVHGAANDSHLKGLLDEARVSNVARSAAELELYLPAVTTLPATPSVEGRVDLHGIANPHGLYTTAYFEYSTSPNLDTSNATAIQLIGAGTRDTAITQTFPFQQALTYYYRLVAKTDAGISYGATLSTSISGVHDNAVALNTAALSANYPNPFFARTTFSASLSADQLARATLRVYDALGRSVVDATDQLRAHPDHITLEMPNMPAGSYHCVLETASHHVVRSLVVSR